MNAIKRLSLCVALFVPVVATAQADLNAPLKRVRVSAWHSRMSDGSVTSVMTDAQGVLSEVNPFWYGINARGELVETNRDSVEDFETVAAGAGIQIVPVIRASFKSQRGKDLLASSTVRTRLIDSLVAAVKASDFGGIEVNFKDVSRSSAVDLETFVRDLAEKLHAEKKVVSVVVPSRIFAVSNPGYNYGRLAEHTDRVKIEAYGLANAETAPGPLASLNIVRKSIVFGFTQIPVNKLAIALPLYAIDWAEGGKGRYIGSDSAEALRKRHGVNARFDSVTGSTQFTYTKEGVKHTVVYQDSRSIEAKLALVKELGVRNVALWSLGMGNDSLWSSIRRGTGNDEIFTSPSNTEETVTETSETPTSVSTPSTPVTTTTTTPATSTPTTSTTDVLDLPTTTTTTTPTTPVTNPVTPIEPATIPDNTPDQSADLETIASHKNAAAVLQAFDRGFNRGGASRNQVTAALQQRRNSVLNEMKSVAGSAVGKISSAQAKLKNARQRALALINNESAYNYSNSGRVTGQEQVDAAVGQLREIWSSKSKLARNSKLKPSADFLNVLYRGVRKYQQAILPALSASDLILMQSATQDVPFSRMPSTVNGLYIDWRNGQVRAFNDRFQAGTEEKACVRVINNYRDMFGLPRLAFDKRLQAAARSHSVAMRDRKFFSYISPVAGQRTPIERIQAAGTFNAPKAGDTYVEGNNRPSQLAAVAKLRVPTGAAENIAGGAKTGLEAFNLWYTSPGHHRNMVAPYDAIGAGQAGVLWTLNVASVNASR